MSLLDQIDLENALVDKIPVKVEKSKSLSQLAFIDAFYDMLIDRVESQKSMDSERRSELVGLAKLLRSVATKPGDIGRV